jgi:2-polyprenyl-3-methyl-5-hydroxy-6-metoxy-1,4-benzoquinol methylase
VQAGGHVPTQDFIPSELTRVQNVCIAVYRELRLAAIIDFCMASAPFSHPDPGIIFSELQAFQRSMALKGAIELDLFTHIDNGAATAADIAEKTHATARGVRALCDFLTVHGHLTKSGGRYALTPTSQMFLSTNSRAYVGSVAHFLLHEAHMSGYKDIADVVRRGGPPNIGIMHDESVWVTFARAMAPVAFSAAEVLAKALQSEGSPKSVLDIAASHGMFGAAVARVNPGAQITALDLPTILEVTRETVSKMGLTDRFIFKPGSVFDVDLGSGYDLVLLTNFVHGFDRETNVMLLRKIRAAMTPGGRIALVEMVPDEDRISPPMAATFALSMLANTQGGDAYTFAELENMLKEAGFHEACLGSLAPTPQQSVIAKN